MKAKAKLLAGVLVAAGTMVAVEASAQHAVARGARGAGIAAAPRSAGVDHGGRGGHWRGGGRWQGRHGHWGGARSWSPRWSFYFGVPVFWGSYYWGSPHWDQYYHPRETIVYREIEREPYPEAEISEPTTEVPRSEGAPTQGPLYMNYCESARAYFPKATSCPEGWKLKSPTE